MSRQLGTQFAHRTKENVLDGPFTPLQDFGYLSDLELPMMPQDKDGALQRSELIHCPFDVVSNTPSFLHLGRIGIDSSGAESECLMEWDEGSPSLPFLVSAVIQASADGDPVKPGTELGLSPKSRQGTISLDEYFLHAVLRIIRVSGHLSSQKRDLTMVTFHYFAKSIQITDLGSGQKFALPQICQSILSCRD